MFLLTLEAGSVYNILKEVTDMAVINDLYHLNKTYFSNPLSFGGVSIFQIGRRYCNGGTLIPLHIHGDYFELTIITDGKGTITTNGVPVQVQKGDIYLSLPCESHKIVSDFKEPLKYDFFAFLCTDNEKREEFDRITENYYSPNSRVFYNEKIRGIVSGAIAELDANKQYSAELLDCVFKEIVIRIIRSFTKIKPEKYTQNVTAAEVICYKLMNYIDTHIYSLKSLKELEDFTDYSYGYLSSLFKKTTGNSLNLYYREKRLEAARLLIIENRLKSTEISEMLGYSSVYAFSKAFTSRFSMSPREYRKNYNLIKTSDLK